MAWSRLQLVHHLAPLPEATKPSKLLLGILWYSPELCELWKGFWRIVSSNGMCKVSWNFRMFIIKHPFMNKRIQKYLPNRRQPWNCFHAWWFSWICVFKVGGAVGVNMPLITLLSCSSLPAPALAAAGLHQADACCYSVMLGWWSSVPVPPWMKAMLPRKTNSVNWQAPIYCPPPPSPLAPGSSQQRPGWGTGS